MNAPNSRRDFVVALLIAVWAHVGLFFAFVLLMVFDLLSAKVIEQDESEEEKPPPIKMQMVYAEDAVSLPVETPLPEVALEPEPTPEPELVMPDSPAFVQTNESQLSEEAPEETPLIGERNTTATSDAGAVAGDEKMAALSGTEDRKSDPKTFDSDFSEGENSGPQEGMSEAVEAGKGDEQENLEEMVAEVAQPEAIQPETLDEALPEVEEELPKPKNQELASIEETLAALEEAMGDREKKQQPKPAEKVLETMPEKPAAKAQEAASQDGGFAPKATKTRIAGVMSAGGKGSLNVADTPAGRYEAALLKKLESAWQMENINNRSLLAPGNVTLYFVVDQNGKVSRQKRISMVGASGTQWGMILRAVDMIAIPKMPQAVIKDLDGDALELIVTFNY